MTTATTSSDAHLLTWSAMGTTCRAWLVGQGAAEATASARALVAHLEDRWSRFLPTSDIGRLNAAGGHPVLVAPETIDVLREAISWWQVTGGWFDPTVADALVAAGYDRDRAAGHGPIRAGVPAPGCDGIVLDRRAGTVQLPRGVHVDLGGIGKGRATDVIVAQLDHLPGGLIDLGGDLRVWGTPPADQTGWPIAIADLRDDSTVALLGLAEGAVATSSSLRRCWAEGDRAAHHLIDPHRGAPTRGELVAATVVAGSATTAEVLAKAAVVSGTVEAARRLLDGHDVDGLLIPVSGPAVAVGGFDELCWASTGAEI